jgi:hypothetical protein
MPALSVWRVTPETDKGRTETALVIARDKSLNERYYDETYMKWQQPLNKIGGFCRMRVFHGIHSSFPWTCHVKMLGIGLDLDVVRDPLEVPSSSQDLVNVGVGTCGMPICELRQLRRIVKSGGVTRANKD